MHLRHALTTILLAICCADIVLGRNVLRIRQDSGAVASTTPTPTDGGATSSNTSPTSSATPTDTTKGPTNTKETSKTKTTEGGPTHVITTSQPSVTPAAGSQNATESAKGNELPLEPVITPAIGITGVILLCTGLAYAIIGIKHKWLLVFLSAAYLASLSITVLIIYVMSPPVSDAIQGAYFVAAVATGLIFGAISLVFKEVTEGFGCIVGGFCLSMWFLVLKPGGLIESTTGRAIMIGAFSAVGWSLAFSQYTRTYGTIICTSFGGAMISMIGIDCFTRAGLKEFWIYIWGKQCELPLYSAVVNKLQLSMTRSFRFTPQHTQSLVQSVSKSPERSSSSCSASCRRSKSGRSYGSANSSTRQKGSKMTRRGSSATPRSGSGSRRTTSAHLRVGRRSMVVRKLP